MEKFAPRYGQGGRWDVAVDFYERLHDTYPSDTSITRKLAGGYRRLGDEESFERYAREALAVDLEFVRSDPLLPSDVRFLAQSYRLLGQEEEAERSLRQALEIDVERLRAEPSSAEAVHSLGLTYKLLGESEKALRQFERARALERDNWEYRKDLLRARSR
jgi:tetratricopeptide (TPR) repeat protein